jgi:hypothetical protein
LLVYLICGLNWTTRRGTGARWTDCTDGSPKPSIWRFSWANGPAEESPASCARGAVDFETSSAVTGQALLGRRHDVTDTVWCDRPGGGSVV